jgi:hypothetical protein
VTEGGVPAGGRGDAGPAWRRQAVAVAVAAVIVIGVVLGYVGWVLPEPGGSVVGPAAVVLGIGVAVTVIGAAVAYVVRPQGELAFVAVMAVLTGLAIVWTWALALPVQMAWDGGATGQAQAALQRVEDGPKVRGVPRWPCVDVTTGHVGPLAAPYRECAVATSEGHFVTFTVAGSKPVRGIGYTDIGAATFEDECYRHLTGRWWMFVADASGIGNCPIGYRFHGGG